MTSMAIDTRPTGPAIRDGADGDIAAIQAIYAHHVLNGLASFEEVAPSVEQMAERRAGIVAQGFPYLVAESAGRVVGYTYASHYRTRSAYRFTLEDSVYVAPDQVGRGVGRALLQALIARCEAGPWRQMVAVIGDSGNAASIGLHAAAGFRMIGRIEAIGFKFGRWVDSVIMQRGLGAGAGSLPD